MKTVEFKHPVLVGGYTWPPKSVTEVSDECAADLVKLGLAVVVSKKAAEKAAEKE